MIARTLPPYCGGAGVISRVAEAGGAYFFTSDLATDVISRTRTGFDNAFQGVTLADTDIVATGSVTITELHDPDEFAEVGGKAPRI